MEEKLYNLDPLIDNVNNDQEELQEILYMFLELVPDTLSQMETAYRDQNYDELSRLANKMKTSLKLLEIKSLESEVLIIEKNSIEKRNLDELDKKMKILKQTLPEVLEQIKSSELLKEK